MRTLAIVAILAAAGCARTIDPASHTGPDGGKKGARAMALEGTIYEGTGIVTYPGGDRIDWKAIELPADAKGELALELTWRAPRPGLDLAFEVFSEWGDPLGAAEPRRRSQQRRAARNANGHKSLKVTGVKGKVLVRIYAANRGDAGRYTLSATFTPEVPAYNPKFDELLVKGIADHTIVIPEPPKLASVYPPCGDDYDKTNPDCVENPPVCNREKPDKNNPSCKHLCDKNKLDPTNPDCKQFYVCTTATWEDPKINPACADVEPPAPPPPPDPIKLRILNPEIKDGKVWIAIAVAKDSPIAKDWTGDIIDKSTKKPHAKGAFKIIKVVKGFAYATVQMSLDDVNRNLDVVIYPPGSEPAK